MVRQKVSTSRWRRRRGPDASLIPILLLTRSRFSYEIYDFGTHIQLYWLVFSLVVFVSRRNGWSFFLCALSFFLLFSLAFIFARQIIISKRLRGRRGKLLNSENPKRRNKMLKPSFSNRFFWQQLEKKHSTTSQTCWSRRSLIFFLATAEKKSCRRFFDAVVLRSNTSSTTFL